MRIDSTDRQHESVQVAPQTIQDLSEVHPETTGHLEPSQITQHQEESQVNKMISYISRDRNQEKKRNLVYSFIIVFLSIVVVVMIYFVIQQQQNHSIGLASKNKVQVDVGIEKKDEDIKKPQIVIQLEPEKNQLEPEIRQPKVIEEKKTQLPQSSIQEPLKQSKVEQQQAVDVPSSEPQNSTTQQQAQPISPDVFTRQNFTLWDITPDQKRSLFKQYSSLPQQSKIPRLNSSYIQINSGKDVEFTQYASSFENNLIYVDWPSINLTEQQNKTMNEQFKRQLIIRANRLNGLIKKYTQMYMGKSGQMQAGKGITYQDFLNHLEVQLLTGQDYRNNPKLNRLYQKQKADHEQKYKLNQVKEELHACIVAPSFKNVADFRYAWHIESILQQEYSNWHMVIIDDASPDNTYLHIQKYLKWRGIPQGKIRLIRNKQHRAATENIYYTVHKYCDYNQIMYIFDGDDELTGTQALRLFNAIYQRERLYVLYATFISYDPNGAGTMRLGVSRQYSEQVYQDESYRRQPHLFSQLRCMMSDVFLLMNSSSLRSANGAFYLQVADNAVFYPAMEMSCRRMRYLPDVNYWYNSNTGMNDWRTNTKKQYQDANYHIIRVQPRYPCISDSFKQIYEAVKSSQG